MNMHLSVGDAWEYTGRLRRRAWMRLQRISVQLLMLVKWNWAVRESVTIQLAQCWFPELAISSAKI